MSEHVLVPIDGSERAFDALRFAIRHHSGDDLTVLHVVSPTEGLVGDGDATYVSQETIDAAITRGEGLCERAREIAEEEGALADRRFDSAVRIGRPTSTIVDFAENEGVDHIVMGSQGRSGLSRVLMGSVAETVVRRAPVPVTVVR